EPPNGPFFRGRAASCPTSKKHRAFCYGEREEDARCGTYPEIDPCVPTLDRSRRKERGKRNEDKKYGKPRPHFRLRILHAFRMASFPTAVPRTHSGTAKSLSDAVLNPDCARTVHEWAVSESTGVSF